MFSTIGNLVFMPIISRILEESCFRTRNCNTRRQIVQTGLNTSPLKVMRRAGVRICMGVNLAMAGRNSTIITIFIKLGSAIRRTAPR